MREEGKREENTISYHSKMMVNAPPIRGIYMYIRDTDGTSVYRSRGK